MKIRKIVTRVEERKAICEEIYRFLTGLDVLLRQTPFTKKSP